MKKSKKILLTGMTGNQARPRTSRAKRDYPLVADIMCHWLRYLGYTVDHKICTDLKELATYDVVIMGLGAFTSIVSTFCYQGLWITSNHDNVHFFVDDWQSKLNYPEKASTIPLFRDFFKSIQHYDGFELTSKIKSRLDQTFHNITNGTIVPIVGMFPWGDHLKFTEKTYIHTCLPIDFFGTLLTKKYKCTIIGQKQKKWVFASLMDRSKEIAKLDLGWKIEVYNSKNYISEDELTQVYANNWGAIIPYYYHAGCGYSRPRYKQIIAAESIMIIHPEDAKYIGSAFEHISFAEYESMTKNQLKEIAHLQAKQFKKSLNPLEVELVNLQKYLGLK